MGRVVFAAMAIVAGWISLGVAASAYTETILHGFGGADGFSLIAGLVADSKGDLFGTTCLGGGGNGTSTSGGCGNVFEQMPPVAAGERWTVKVLHTFNGTPNGALPHGDLLIARVEAAVARLAQTGWTRVASAP